ncbi:hypothetical protein BURMUCF2_B0234 [Burkholderia multivorans CF2]|nr:hypothetical protein BURMUCF2_B0234 [Burkholderia multivorans CF2]
MTSLTFLRMRRCGTAADALPRRREIFPNMAGASRRYSHSSG